MLLDGSQEPDGWCRAIEPPEVMRQQGGFRRRPDGDKTKEYIAP
jgi:hypothetical protein